MRRIGAISISMAAMKATKPPTVTSRFAIAPWLCHSAMQITADSATAASSCVSGVVAAEAMVDLIASWRRRWLRRAKRLAWLACAPCRRTMRCASTFSSTT